MAGIKELRLRIKSVGNIKQITRAMEMVATQKLKKLQMRAEAARPFAEFVTERVSWSLDGASIDFDHASFGHSVVEVEVMCERAEQVEDAEKKVEEVATTCYAWLM